MHKILVLSDTHLSHIFQPEKFEVLKRLVTYCDRVILNGDFWEGYLSSFDQFVASPWQELFPLLKGKNAAYLYGNHDLESLSDERRALFSTSQGDSLELQSGSHTFHFEHGNRIVQILGGDHPPVPPFVLRLIPRLEATGLFRRKPEYTNSRYRSYNSQMKSWAASNLPQPKILVCGHSHLAEIDLEDRFVNSGIFKWGLAQYLTIEDGVVTAHTEYY